MAVNPSIQLGTSGNWAIKEDNLLAYKQLGNKFFDREFDFSRGTRATFVGRNGLIQESGLTSAELVTNGDFATDSNWAKINANISNGLATITVTNGVFSALTQSTTYATGKEYIVTAQIQGLSGSSGKQIKFQDRGNNTGGLREGNGLITLDETLQNIEISWTANSNSTEIVIARQSNSGDYSFTIDNVSVKEIQLDVPRIDFTDDPTGHLLLEPQSTNLFTYSNDFSQWSSLSGASVINNALVSPDGTLNADEFVFDGTNNGRIEKSLLTTNGLDYTFSIYLKNKNITNPTQVFIGTRGSVGMFVTVTNEWQRFTQVTSPAETNAFPQVRYSGVGSLYAYGAQFEQLPYATSYIPTSGSAVTRNQELCNNSGTVNDFNSEEGVLYAEIAALADDGTYRLIALLDPLDNTNRLDIGFSTNDGIYANVRTSGNNKILSSTVDYNIGQYYKIAIKWSNTDGCSFYLDGVEIQTGGNTFFTTSDFTSLQFRNAFNNPLYGKTKCVAVFKEALNNDELECLTGEGYETFNALALANNYTII